MANDELLKRLVGGDEDARRQRQVETRLAKAVWLQNIVTDHVNKGGNIGDLLDHYQRTDPVTANDLRVVAKTLGLG